MGKSLNFNGNLVTFTAGAANAENIILHGMRAVPRGFIVVKQSAAGRLYMSGTQLNSLLTTLSGGWEFESAASLGLDSGPNTLNMTNSVSPVTQVAGKVAYAGNFTRASSQALTITDNILLRPTSSFTMAAWVNLASKPAAGVMDIFTNGNNLGGNATFTLRWNTAAVDRFIFLFLKSDSSGYVSALANTFGAPTIGDWNFVVGRYDAVAAKLYISVNNGTEDSGASALGPYTNVANVTSIGRFGAYTTGNYFDGKIDQVMFWKRSLTAAEITALYNAGSGITVSTILAYTPTPWTATQAFIKSSIAGATYSVLFFA